MIVAACQVDAAYSPDRRVDLGRRMQRLAAQGASLVVLPELALTGYDLADDLRALAARFRGDLKWLQTTAADLGVVIVTSMITTDAAGLRDRAVVVDPSGAVGWADKRFLWGDERQLFVPGSAAPLVVETAAGVVGVAVCFEAGFPEVVRNLSVRGAQLIAVPAAFGRARVQAWELSTRSRALENGVYMVAAGFAGANPHGVEFCGRSRVVGPRGDLAATLATEPGDVLAHVD
ncbi:MAG: carbon-nitrogen hydrolase family protein, partial [Actinomycetota bacterium]|nr:carbon-nitrogen hydrolase family protein [Actinomycetota bacterium]